MSRLDKMEDYDRLKQERDELAAQVEVMRATASEAIELADALVESMDYLGTGSDSRAAYAAQEVDRSEIIRLRSKISITQSAALREIEARVLEEAASTYDELRGTTTRCGCYLREMAAAKRKGEE